MFDDGTTVVFSSPLIYYSLSSVAYFQTSKKPSSKGQMYYACLILPLYHFIKVTEIHRFFALYIFIWWYVPDTVITESDLRMNLNRMQWDSVQPNYTSISSRLGVTSLPFIRHVHVLLHARCVIVQWIRHCTIHFYLMCTFDISLLKTNILLHDLTINCWC
jgi:hypothetical protein